MASEALRQGDIGEAGDRLAQTGCDPHEVRETDPGKAADLTAVDLGSLELAPCYDPVSHLVYAASRNDVTHVWVAGMPVVENRLLTTVDRAALAARARYWQERLA